MAESNKNQTPGENEEKKLVINDNVDAMLDLIHRRREAENASLSRPAPEKADTKEHTAAPAPAKAKEEADRRIPARAAEAPRQNAPDAPSISQSQPQPQPQNQAQPQPQAPSQPQKAAHITGQHPAQKAAPKAHVVDFDEIDPENARIRRDKQRKKNARTGRGAALGLFKTLLYVAAVLAVSIFLSVVIIRTANDVYAFVKPDISVTITIPAHATADDVAKILEENGVIRCPLIFRLYAEREFRDSEYYNGEFVAGEHTILFRNEAPSDSVDGYTDDYVRLSEDADSTTKPLNYDRLISLLAVSTYRERETVKVTIPEGYTVDEIIDLLVSSGVGTRENYVDVIEHYDYEYRFVREIPENENRKYRLEGYLFPDTYEFFTDESEISVINKLLVNFEQKFESVYYDRADELGMTVDDLIILASILEKEAKYAEDLTLMSSVFHNRLKAGMMLGSDATVMYLLPEHKSALTTEDLAIDSPYNTRLYRGLPPGAISNPGIDAINAAFYPTATSYYYFLTKTNGETVYSSTEAEHSAARSRARAEGTLAS